MLFRSEAYCGYVGLALPTGTPNCWRTPNLDAIAAAYGVFSSGRLGVTGPIELSPLTLSNYTVPAGKAILYVKTVSGVTELHVRFPSGVDRLITSG